MSSDLAIQARGLGKQYRIGASRPRYATLRETMTASAVRLARRMAGRGAGRADQPAIWALKDVSFDIARGDVVGIVGGNGAGKSTLLKILSRITEPTEGGATVFGRVGSLLEVGTGFHPELTGRENIFLNGAILGMSRAHVQRQFDAIVDFSGVSAFIDTPVRFYSSGMYVRLAFAVAAHMEPDILVVDEVLAVGDAEFQRRCLGKMDDVSRDGRTILFVSHNLEALQRLCTRGLLLRQGRLVADGTIGDVVSRYRAGNTLADAGRFNPAARKGQGWARFTDIRVRSASAPDGRCHSDDDLIVEMDVDLASAASGSLRGLLIEIVISTEDGYPLCSLMTADHEAIALPETGGAAVSLRIPAPTFIPGRYRLRAFLGVPFLQHVDEIDDALEFEVQAPREPWRPYPLHPSRGAVCVRGRWHCTPLAPALQGSRR